MSVHKEYGTDLPHIIAQKAESRTERPFTPQRSHSRSVDFDPVNDCLHDKADILAKFGVSDDDVLHFIPEFAIIIGSFFLGHTSEMNPSCSNSFDTR
jgi:hypothetical protein